jgi:NOL1/NOP2/sun family putative RNA methylase
MPKSPEQRLERKKAQWIMRTALALHISEETTNTLLSINRQQSIRLNPLRQNPQQSLARLQETGWQGNQFEWCTNGLSVPSGLEEIKRSELVQDGSLYIQNAASWIPVLQLNPKQGENILDMCAAPGGKTSHIAAISENKACITANDNSKPRLAKLQKNLESLNVTGVKYTLYDATKLSQKLPQHSFDAILLDAPCSGEGMMTLSNDKDFSSWSVAHIKRLQQLQKRLIVEAWNLLKPGGRLVYSTCTMAPEENEAVIDYLLRHNQDANVESINLELPNIVPAVREWNGRQYDNRLQFAMRLIPSPEIEAFFVCKLTKTAPSVVLE